MSFRDDLPRNVKVLNTHPLLKVLITELRNCATAEEFAQKLKAITWFLAQAATQEYQTEQIRVPTPLGLEAHGVRRVGRSVLVPMGRAAQPMAEPFQILLQGAGVCPVKTRRSAGDATAWVTDSLLPHVLHDGTHTAFVLSPTLSTGASAKVVMHRVMTLGFERLVFVAALAAPKGMDRLSDAFPQARIFLAHMDDGLNEEEMIVPGIGNIKALLAGI